jgi:hypothetical protein
MGRPPKDPFWDTVDDATPAVPRANPLARARQGPSRIDQSAIITEPGVNPKVLQSAEAALLGELPPDPSGSEHRGVTSSLRAPLDVPLQPAGAELRTSISNQAVMIADLVRERFAGKSYGSAFYRLRIDEPDGPSTGGGRHARQHLTLEPRMDSAPAIICGWVDVSIQDAQLRSYEMMVRRHEGRAFPLSAEIYDRFLDDLMNTLYEGGIRIMLVVPDDDEEASPAPAPVPERRRPFLSFLKAVFYIGLGFGLGWNSERLMPVIEQVRPWIEQMPVWLEKVPTWFEVAKRLVQRFLL